MKDFGYIALNEMLNSVYTCACTVENIRLELLNNTAHAIQLLNNNIRGFALISDERQKIVDIVCAAKKYFAGHYEAFDKATNKADDFSSETTRPDYIIFNDIISTADTTSSINNLNLDNRIEDSKKEHFGASKKEKDKEMPIQYADGCFRWRGNSLEYRFMFEGDQLPVYGKSKQDCWNQRTDIITGKVVPKKKASKVRGKLLGEWMVEWYNLYKVRKDGTKINPNQEKYINDYVVPILGNVPLKDLTGEQIQLFLKEYDDRTNTREKLYVLFNQSLEMAKENELIKKSPLKTVKIEKHIYEHYPVIRISTQNQILQSIPSKYDKYKKLFMFCCCTGLRISEAINSIENIDFANNIIDVLEEDTSTKKHRREIPFLPELIDADTAKILSQIKVSTAQSFFKRLYKKHGLKLVVHSFRVTFLSCCNYVGMNIKQIQELAGHSTIKTTMDTYVKLLRNEGTSPVIEYIKRLKIYLETGAMS